MAYWDKGSKGSRNHGLPASLTDEFIKLDGEVSSPRACGTVSRRRSVCELLVFPRWSRRPRRSTFTCSPCVEVCRGELYFPILDNRQQSTPHV